MTAVPEAIAPPAIIEPAPLSECVRRHLGGQWAGRAVTDPNYWREHAEFIVELLHVRTHCANGTENQLL
jgi:hypothetical protein